MKNSELSLLRKQVREEILKRKALFELIKDESVKELLEHFGIQEEKANISNIREILIGIIKNIKITKTNEIYVCTKAYDEDYHAPCIYYTVPSGRYTPDVKCYKNIETGEETMTSKIYGPTILEFEKNHIVLNPYNVSYDDKIIRENGYNEVRLDFFEECYKNGQNKAVLKILKKYPRI